MDTIAEELRKGRVVVRNGHPAIIQPNGKQRIYGEQGNYPLEWAVLLLNSELTESLDLSRPVWSAEQAARLRAQYSLPGHSNRQIIIAALHHLLRAREHIYEQFHTAESEIATLAEEIKDMVSFDEVKTAALALRHSRFDIADPLLRPYSHFRQQVMQSLNETERLLWHMQSRHVIFFLEHITEQITEMRSLLELIPADVVDYAEEEPPPAIV